jgi:predicted  nucleic acid-binding Zn-ribbon protein
MSKKLSLVDRILAELKAGDNGKINSFFLREDKALSRSIEAQETNKKVASFNLATQLTALNDQLADAKEALKHAYMAIEPANVATNALQDSFSKVYWANIEEKEAAVKYLEKQIKSVNEKHEKFIKETDEKIAKIKYRMNVIDGSALAD